jgi:hypothetical protein
MTKSAEENGVLVLNAHIEDIIAISEALRMFNKRLRTIAYEPTSPSEKEAKRNQVNQDIRCLKRLIIMKSSLICRKDIIMHEHKL